MVNLCPRGRCWLTSLNYVQIYRDGRARELLIRRGVARRGVASRLLRVLARWEVFCSGQEAFMRAGLLLGLWNLVRQEYIKRVGRSSVLSALRPRAILFCFVFFFWSYSIFLKQKGGIINDKIDNICEEKQTNVTVSPMAGRLGQSRTLDLSLACRGK